MRFTYIDSSFAASNLTHMVKRPNATADHIDHRIHVADEDGHMLLYIANCGLRVPWELNVDKRDNLFVAELRDKN